MGNEGSHKDLTALGMRADILEHIKQLLKRPYGLLLICGPYGQGKTVTLYAMLRMLNLKETKLICLEDPVEAEIRGPSKLVSMRRLALPLKGLRSVPTPRSRYDYDW